MLSLAWLPSLSLFSFSLARKESQLGNLQQVSVALSLWVSYLIWTGCEGGTHFFGESDAKREQLYSSLWSSTEDVQSSFQEQRIEEEEDERCRATCR